MMDESDWTRAVEGFSAVLSYPRDGYAERAGACARALGDSPEDARDGMERFASFAAGRSLEELEEAFTRTFDLNPVCALEVGWHLYGEAYERGAFLVKSRELLRRHGIEESGELPDHLSLLLPLLVRMPEEEAGTFARGAVTKAVGKMLEGFKEADNPYRRVIGALREALVERYGPPEEDAQAPAWAASLPRFSHSSPGGLP